jgi:2-(1,2-epoxy-1,2-dihydrophenyl)acetyl-CoA isomerase
MDYQNLRYEISDGVAAITLDRPDAANAIDLPLARELMQVAIRCDEDPAVRAVLLTGAGKMFCPGGDLKSFASAGAGLPALLKEITTHLHAATSRLARMTAPLVVAVNGTAAGAGFSIAISGDLVLMAESAQLAMAYTAARLIGLRRAQELMLTNRRLSAAESLAWGLVNQVVPDAELASTALALAKQLAAGPTRAFGEVKKLLASTFSESLETQMELEARGIAAMAGGADGREGIEAFVAKRAPKFSGR